MNTSFKVTVCVLTVCSQCVHTVWQCVFFFTTAINTDNNFVEEVEKIVGKNGIDVVYDG
mgnify:CR=1 FL=1